MEVIIIDRMINRLILRELKRPKDRRHRAIIYLYYDYGYTQQEIGAMLGVHQSTISRLRNKAIKGMMEMVK